MLEHSLHFPGTHQSVVPWAQSGMSLAVVLVAFTVLLLSCCGAAALILVACCSSRRRDTVGESSDSRWLPGVGVIDYVPVSNRSSVRVSLVLSEGSQDLELPAERPGTPDDPLLSLRIMSPGSTSPPSPAASEFSSGVIRDTSTATTPTCGTSSSHSASGSPTKSSCVLTSMTEHNSPHIYIASRDANKSMERDGEQWKVGTSPGDTLMIQDSSLSPRIQQPPSLSIVSSQVTSTLPSLSPPPPPSSLSSLSLPCLRLHSPTDKSCSSNLLSPADSTAPSHHTPQAEVGEARLTPPLVSLSPNKLSPLVTDVKTSSTPDKQEAWSQPPLLQIRKSFIKH